MFDPKAYTTRAYYASPAEFTQILLDGANDYAQQLSAMVNAAPHQDLPLIIAVMEISARLLRGHVRNQDYVPFLVAILSENSAATAVLAEIPREKEAEP